MKLSRRTVIKGGGALGAGLLASQYLPPWLIPSRGGETADVAVDAARVTEDWVPTTCWIGKQDCAVLARRIDGRVVKLEGHPGDPRTGGTLCPKGMSQIQAVYDPHRVKTPLIRTNEKGVRGEWRKATWDEALTLAGERIKEVRERDPRLLIWQKGRSKAAAFYDNAFVHASGATKLHHGGFCSDAGYRACEYTVGLHGVLNPDLLNTRYLLSFGWDPLNGGGNKFCQIVWHRQLLQAREQGLKMVHLDPSRRVAGPFADEWLPIRPGTDLAFFLAVANVLIEEGFIDEPYLTSFTNAPFLVKADGTFLRETAASDQDSKPLLWDEAARRARPYDEPGVAPALTGAFNVGGEQVKTAFQLFIEHVAPYTPEWAAEITGLAADSIRHVAMEMGEAARIGSTTVVDGVEVPYRPVAIMAYHVAQQELGFQAVRAALLVEMLLGAVGAVGGQFVDFTWKVHDNYAKFESLSIKDPPYNIYLKDSKYFPINSNNSSLVAHVMNDPDRYEVDYVPEVLIIHMTNPLLSFPDQPALIESYKKFKFVVAIDPWLSETADLFADVILPAATIEKYEGPTNLGDGYVDAVSLRVPPMAPLFESRGDIDIYLDLCEKAGILYGEGGYIDEINKELKLGDEFAFSLNERPEVRDIFDRWAKAQGIAEGVAYFESTGVLFKGELPAAKRYGYAADPPFGGAVHRLYGESLKVAQDRMKELGVDEVYWRLYTPFPTWMPATAESSPSEYDLYLVSRKMIEFKQSRTTFVPILNELSPKAFVEINPATAKERGIDDGDEIWVESHNAVTGETRKVKSRARYLETIRPDTVCMPHHYGFFSNPITEGQGPTPNQLFFSGPGYVANTADQSFHVKVRVWKA